MDPRELLSIIEVDTYGVWNVPSFADKNGTSISFGKDSGMSVRALIEALREHTPKPIT